MARRRIARPQQVKDLDDANRALAEIGSLQVQLENIDARANEEIGKIKERAAKEGERARDRIKDLEGALSLYAEYNKAELFKDRKTVELSYGPIGFRESTKVSIKKSTLDLLKKLFGGKAIRVKETVDKDELRTWPDEDLAQVDAAKITQDVFWYEVNREEVNKRILEAG